MKRQMVTVLFMAMLMASVMGCGASTSGDTTAVDGQMLAEAVTEVDTEEPTEQSTEVVVEEETETETVEDDVIAIGYPVISEGHDHLIVFDQPSHYEHSTIGEIYEGELIKIVGEYYIDEEQEYFYRVRLINGEEGYISKKYVQLAE